MTRTPSTLGLAPAFRANTLALFLSAALLSQQSAALALASPTETIPARKHFNFKRMQNHPVAQPWIVKNCTDHDTDSLRDIIINKVQSGDTVDLSQLPTLCNSINSTITLSSGEIPVSVNDLTLWGPDSTHGTVTISGGGTSRVFAHVGNGQLTLASLTVTGGYRHVDGSAFGGCIASAGDIYLNESVVTYCKVTSNAGPAAGGGLYAIHDITLVRSTISENHVSAPMKGAFGGGICANSLTSYYSSISNNSAQSGDQSIGGGAYGQHATIYASTINNNTSYSSGGLSLSFGFGAQSLIANSTISENTAQFRAALSAYTVPLLLSNSTIAFNHSTNAADEGAVYFGGTATLTLQSSIIANNTVGAAPSDLHVGYAYGSLAAGADNLIVSSNVGDPSIVTVTADPHLGALGWNGGRTRTHAILSGSPAIGRGNTTGLPSWMSNDQRGRSYPRWTGQGPSIDIGAVQSDRIFVAGFES